MEWTKDLPTKKGTYWIRSSAEMDPKLCRVWSPFTQPPEITGQGYEVQFFGSDEIHMLKYHPDNHPGLEWYGPIGPPGDAPDSQRQPINILFSGPPGPSGCEFVDAETDDGKPIRVGEWIERPDGYWAIRITELPKGNGTQRTCPLDPSRDECEQDCSWFDPDGCLLDERKTVVTLL